MSTISRRLPISNIGRNAALTAAITKKDSAPPSGNILTADTTIRLDTHQPLYKAAINEVDNAQAVLSTNTTGKNIRIANCRMFCSHLIQTFNLAVERGEAPAGHRAYYGLEVGTGKLPDMNSEAEILAVADKLISGDAARITAGGFVMSLPTIAQVTAARTAAQTAVSTQSNLNDVLDDKQEILEALNTEADLLIKRMWAEIEARYAEETIESRRDNAREWGVVYVTIGNKTKINFIVTEQVDGAPVAVADALMHLQSADLETRTNETGTAVLNTTIIGDELLIGTATGFQPIAQNLVIVEGEEQTVAVTMQRIV